MDPASIREQLRGLLDQGDAALAGVDPEDVVSLFRDSFYEIRRVHRSYKREVVLYQHTKHPEPRHH